MKVLQVVPSYYPAFVYGGPIFSIHYACQALARRGVEIAVATTNANGAGKLDVSTREPVTFEDNYRVHYYDDTIISRFSLDFTRHLWRDLKAAQVVHLQDVFSTHAAWAMMLAWAARKPILISARGTFTTWGLRSRRPWLKKMWLALFVRPFIGDTRRANWHATGGAERDEILALFPSAKVHVVPNGIDCSPFDSVPALSRPAYLSRFLPNSAMSPEKGTVLACLGRVHPVKGFDIAIRSLHLIVDSHPESVLLIAGGNDGERAPLERLIAELGLQGRVALVGEVKGEEKIAFLKGADLFLFPSHSENFGMAALEALAAGLPVVASRNTPWAGIEAIGAGLWVENTPEAFARAITDILPRSRTVLAKNAQALANRYDLTIVAAELEAIYADLASGRPGGNHGHAIHSTD